MEPKSRIESEEEVKAYIQNLRYAIDNGAQFRFQERSFGPETFPYKHD